MNDGILNAAVTIGLGILGVATLSVILSPKATTANVIGTTGQSFSGSLATALSPLTGSNAGVGVYSSSFGTGFGGGSSLNNLVSTY